MSDPTGNDLNLPPIVGRIQVAWTGERFVFRFPDGQELAYTQEECDPVYTTLYEQGVSLFAIEATKIR